ncbi:hypothetical protein AAG570_007359 [Ranatra chinensis]|uniref:C2H2-type domain-containing protein n=1 Tax=Ranatra chinensis TaxID=642074 RepID=A0ABD0XVM7_9HEMI
MEFAVQVKVEEDVAIKEEVLDIPEIYNLHQIEDEPRFKTEIDVLDIPEIYDDLLLIEDEPHFKNETGFQNVSGRGANTDEFVCHHCGYGTESLRKMRRHTRQHRAEKQSVASPKTHTGGTHR